MGILRLLPLRRSDVLSLNLLTLAASRAEQLPELREEVQYRTVHVMHYDGQPNGKEHGM